jgi:hypothetical protein
MTQQLLGKSYWVESVEADTVVWWDLAVFRLSALCWQPDLLAIDMESFIPDPRIGSWGPVGGEAKHLLPGQAKGGGPPLPCR